MGAAGRAGRCSYWLQTTPWLDPTITARSRDVLHVTLPGLCGATRGEALDQAQVRGERRRLQGRTDGEMLAALDARPRSGLEQGWWWPPRSSSPVCEGAAGVPTSRRVRFLPLLQQRCWTLFPHPTLPMGESHVVPH